MSQPEMPAPALGPAEADSGFIDLLDRAGASLVASLGPHLLACFGAKNGELTQSFTHFEGPLGIAHADGRLAVASQREIVLFALSKRLAPAYPGLANQFDGVFLRTATLHTAGCSTHDLAIDGPEIVFVNTMFSCVARAGRTNTFAPLWQPPFISALRPEDRCHLNSFALDGNRLHYVTLFAPSDRRRGYRDLPVNAGQVIEVTTGRVVLDGLYKPHSARIFHGTLYVLNSGTGEVLRLEPARGEATVLAALPGFARGFCALGDTLLVGLSTLRASAVGLDLPIARAPHVIAGIAAIDRHTGARLGMLTLPAGITEVMDFVPVPGVRRAAVHPPEDPYTPIEMPELSLWTSIASAQ